MSTKSTKKRNRKKAERAIQHEMSTIGEAIKYGLSGVILELKQVKRMITTQNENLKQMKVAIDQHNDYIFHVYEALRDISRLSRSTSNINSPTLFPLPSHLPPSIAHVSTSPFTSPFTPPFTHPSSSRGDDYHIGPQTRSQKERKLKERKQEVEEEKEDRKIEDRSNPHQQSTSDPPTITGVLGIYMQDQTPIIQFQSSDVIRFRKSNANTPPVKVHGIPNGAVVESWDKKVWYESVSNPKKLTQSWSIVKEPSLERQRAILEVRDRNGMECKLAVSRWPKVVPLE
jgi:hypothetical protein